MKIILGKKCTTRSQRIRVVCRNMRTNYTRIRKLTWKLTLVSILDYVRNNIGKSNRGHRINRRRVKTVVVIRSLGEKDDKAMVKVFRLRREIESVVQEFGWHQGVLSGMRARRRLQRRYPKREGGVENGNRETQPFRRRRRLEQEQLISVMT